MKHNYNKWIFLLIGFSLITTSIHSMSNRKSIDESETDIIQKSGMELSYRYDSLYQGNQLWIIQTVCAPICSSVVIIYDKSGKKTGVITPPSHLIFAEAVFDTDSIRWIDNTPVDELR